MLAIYRLDDGGNIIKGIGLPAFIQNGDYYQTTIGIYQDGKIECWGLVSLEEFKKRVSQGKVVTQVPNGARISCHHLFHGFSQLKYFVEISEFVKEVEDALNKLQ